MTQAPIYGYDIGDRKEVFKLLERLPEGERIMWLAWCCERATRNGLPVQISHNSGTQREVYLDFLSLCTSYGLDANGARLELERRARLHGSPLLITAGG